MQWRTSRLAGGRGFAQMALLPIAAYGVHQLRYLLAFGGNAGAELQRTGHSYMHSIVPWIVLALGLAVGGFLRALGRSLAGHVTARRYSASLLGLWLVCTTCLIAIFITQELLEGFFATGHAAGLAGVFGYGGWWAIPAAAAIGLVLASVLHGALWVLTEVERRRARSPGRPSAEAPARPLRPAPARTRRLAPVVAGWSGRGPPA